ncbi:MAG: hypothetical protein IJU37_04255 [Desulfovibrio sp.]|nr:hypothetical protein [Desulfovibrio sp.]
MANADLRYVYDVVEKDRRDAVAHEAYVRQEGYQEGEKKGMYKIIANMIAKGLLFQDISDMTGLSLAEVRTFAAQKQAS